MEPSYSLIVSTETTFPLIIPVLIVIDLLSLAKLSRTLIASSKFLENKSAFGPSRNSVKSNFKSSRANLTNVFL